MISSNKITDTAHFCFSLPRVLKRLGEMTQPVDKRGKQRQTLFAGGLDAAAFASLLTLIQRERLSDALYVALGAFAICIPMLTAVLMCIAYTDDHEFKSTKVRLEILLGGTLVLGMVAFLTGTGALFFHYGRLVGILFAASVLGALILGGRYSWKLSRLNPQNSTTSS